MQVKSLKKEGIVEPDVDNSLFDSYLLTQFPGRTLDELDDMDLLRFLRAMEARNVSSLEESRYMVETGKKKGSEIDKEDWDIILEHNKIWDEYTTPKRVSENA